MTLLILAPNARPKIWAREIKLLDPNLDVRIWPNVDHLDDITYALVWDAPKGILSSLPNLRIIFSMGAGVDHFFLDSTLPENVTICRVVDSLLTDAMCEYVILHTLRYHRNQPELEKQQKSHTWNDLSDKQIHAKDQTIGVLGMGELGKACATILAEMKFSVYGWSRSPKNISGVSCFHGTEGRKTVLQKSKILICLLPLTKETKGILNACLFSKLPKGAYLINAGRGQHLVEEDLLSALDIGQLSYATLDVFNEEPLPVEHPFWEHPQITITPHNASITDPKSVSKQIYENIRREAQKIPLLNTVNRRLEY